MGHEYSYLVDQSLGLRDTSEPFSVVEFLQTEQRCDDAKPNQKLGGSNDRIFATDYQI